MGHGLNGLLFSMGRMGYGSRHVTHDPPTSDERSTSQSFKGNTDCLFYKVSEYNCEAICQNQAYVGRI